MKKITKRLAIRREVLQHLDLRIVAGGIKITTPTKPNASCTNCTISADPICTTAGPSCRIGPTGVC